MFTYGNVLYTVFKVFDRAPPCLLAFALSNVEFPLNEQIFNTIGIKPCTGEDICERHKKSASTE